MMTRDDREETSREARRNDYCLRLAINTAPHGCALTLAETLARALAFRTFIFGDTPELKRTLH